MTMLARTCKGRTQTGEPCRQAPMKDSDYCFWHSPEHVEEAMEARRLGGLRRRREKITSGAYEFEGLVNVGNVVRLLEIAILDTLGLENSVARSRTLAYLALVALKALEVGNMEERLEDLEETLGTRMGPSGGRR